tara:strand:+ start:123 stop:326 length:204 start_codon:yes stop_codon:yes gene_type:complete
MYVTGTTRVNDIPLDVFRLMARLEEIRLCVGDDWVWLTLGEFSNETQFFLTQEDSAIYRTEIGEEEE